MMTQSERIAQRRARAVQIVAQIREILPAALEAHPIAAAYIYGSVARSTPLPTSDLDIALVTQPLTLSPYEQLTLELEIQADIEDAARADTGAPPAEIADVDAQPPLPTIDVRIINDAPLLVRGRVLQEGVLVYEGDHQTRVNFEVATLGRYFDYAPVARRLQQALLDHVHREGMLNG